MLTILARYPDLTESLGKYVIAASRLKWQLLYYTASAVAGVGCYCLFSGRQRRAQQEQQQEQRTQRIEQQQNKPKQQRQQKQYRKGPR